VIRSAGNETNMKTAMYLCVLVGFAVTLSAQTKSGNPAPTKPRQPAGTRIGPHRLGETFNEWLAVEKIDLDAVCKSGARSVSIPENGINAPKDVVEKYMTDSLRQKDDATTCSDLSPISETGSGDYDDHRGLGTAHVDSWTFENRILVEKQSVYDVDIAAKELGFLKEAYGAPVSITKTPQQNGFGARWNDILATWHLPGTIIFMKALGGPEKDLIVTFISKAYANRPTSREPNPYLSNKP
jgi:hypothetical protein